MTALTYGIVTTDRLAWGSLGVLGPVAAGVALLLAFGLYENNLARQPDRTALMPLSVFKLRNLRAANLVIFLLYARDLRLLVLPVASTCRGLSTTARSRLGWPSSR